MKPVGVLASGMLIAALTSSVLSASAATIRGQDETQTATIEAATGASPATWEWEPPEVTIQAGDRVKWTNPTSETHALQAWAGEWELNRSLRPDTATSVRFGEPGEYAFRCSSSLHSDILYLLDQRICVGMCGTVTVL